MINTKKNLIYVAEYDNKIVGFVIYHDFLMQDGILRFIDDFGVSKSFRRKGIGTALMKKIESEKIKRFWLLSKPNSNAYLFYKSLGYKNSGWINMEKYKE